MLRSVRHRLGRRYLNHRQLRELRDDSDDAERAERGQSDSADIWVPPACADLDECAQRPSEQGAKLLRTAPLDFDLFVLLEPVF